METLLLMNRSLLLSLSLLLALVSTASCKKTATDTRNDKNIAPKKESLGNFNADSAYSYIEKQLEFGPRVPGTDGHKACASWLEGKLRETKPDTLIVQRGEVRAYTGARLPITNLMASYNRANPNRLLLVAHWDTRPWADNDAVPANHSKPLPGANDGGSGVGVLLEIARNLAIKKPAYGIDILLVDAEDYGRSGGFSDNGDSWCLGTQYFIENLPYPDGLLPRYAIVLDMVGGRDARFSKEYTSHTQAREYTDKIWKEAAALGLADRFPDRVTAGVVDDHTFLNEAGIPAVDIVECDNHITNSFPPYWHTMQDDMSNIDRSTLGDVGKTVLNLVYSPKI